MDANLAKCGREPQTSRWTHLERPQSSTGGKAVSRKKPQRKNRRDSANWSDVLDSVNNEGILELGGGTFNVDALDNAATGEILGFGTINANVINSGIVSPGASPGTLLILGNYTQDATGVLAIGLHGTDIRTP